MIKRTPLGGPGGINDALVPTLLRPVARASRGSQTIVTAFQAGHGWTSNSVGTINLNDTGDAALGSQCVSVTTSGGGNVGGQRSEVSNAALPVFDMTAKALRIWFKIVAGANLNRLTLNVGQDTSNFFNIDIAFPPGDSKNLHVVGEWFVADVDLTGATTIGAPTRTGCDFIRFTITDTGGGNTATVRLGGVALVDKPTTLYPNGVITIGLDDGFADQFSTARPIMDKYGYAATCYVIQDLIGTNPATYMSLDQLKRLRDLHGWEIAAHSATVANHNLTGGFAALTAAQLRAEFETHKTWLLANGFAEGADHFAYPQGLFDAETIAIAREYFTTARTIAPAYYPGPGGLADPQRMRCYPISAGVSAGTLTGLVDQVKANRSWLQVYTHRVLGTGAAGTQIDTATFTTFVDYIAAQGVAVRTVGDVLAGV